MPRVQSRSWSSSAALSAGKMREQAPGFWCWFWNWNWNRVGNNEAAWQRERETQVPAPSPESNERQPGREENEEERERLKHGADGGSGLTSPSFLQRPPIRASAFSGKTRERQSSLTMRAMLHRLPIAQIRRDEKVIGAGMDDRWQIEIVLFKGCCVLWATGMVYRKKYYRMCEFFSE